MIINYAVQVCDTKTNQTTKRITNTSKTEISKRCLTSFFKAVNFVDLNNTDDTFNIQQNIIIVCDSCSPDLITFLKVLLNKYQSTNINIQLDILENLGIKQSIILTYDYLKKLDGDFVYQIQDDYLFYESSIFEMVSLFVQLKQDCNTDSIIGSFNAPSLWNDTYRYKVTPRMIVPGSNRYWIQSYDIACTFLTSKSLFMKHTDIYDNFIDLLPVGINGDLENISLNYLFTKHGVLGMLPINSVAFHLQSERELDNYSNWKLLWEENKT